MKPKKAIFVISSLSILVVVLLFGLSQNTFPTKGAFIRKFPTHAIYSYKKIELKYNSYYIAGKIDSSIYLGNNTANLHILKIDTTLSSIRSITLKIPGSKSYNLKSLHLYVDSPSFYLADGAVPIVFKGSLLTWSALPFIQEKNQFSLIQPIGNNSIIANCLSEQSQQNTLVKWSQNQKPFTPATNVLEKQIDGLFCTDGQLQYDQESAKLIYLYYYRNQFIVMDTNLKVQFKGQTIDTNTRAKIKVAQYNSNGTAKTISSPPYIVNKRFCISKDWLFVNSNLMADNEIKNTFEKCSVIDVYNLKENRYRFSFYISTANKKDLKDFRVFGNKLVIISDHFMETYELNNEYFLNQKPPAP